MKKSIYYLVLAFFIFLGAQFISPTTAQASTSKNLPGAIDLGHFPPGCDCTIPSSTCFCKIPSTTDPIGKG